MKTKIAYILLLIIIFNMAIGINQVYAADNTSPETESFCGNGIIEGYEECDLDDFGSLRCSNYGYRRGSLLCTETCLIDLSDCYNLYRDRQNVEDIVTDEEEIVDDDDDVVTDEEEIVDDDDDVVTNEEEVVDDDDDVVTNEEEVVDDDDDVVTDEEEIADDDDDVVDDTKNTKKDKKIKKKDEIPDRLFDINLEIDEYAIKDIKDLTSRVIFENFGQLTTEVDLTFSIIDKSGEVLYRTEDKTSVETQAVLTKKFEDIDLAPGKYSLVLNTLYNTDVEDEFKQEFEVIEETEAQNLYPLLIGLSLLIGIGGFTLLFVLLAKKKNNNPPSNV